MDINSLNNIRKGCWGRKLLLKKLEAWEVTIERDPQMWGNDAMLAFWFNVYSEPERAGQCCSSKGVCVMLCCAAHSEEVWLQVNCTDFRWIRTTSFLVVLNFISVDFFVKISKFLPNKRCLLYYALTLVEVFRCFPETPCIIVEFLLWFNWLKVRTIRRVLHTT